jgi:hypothetical protein
LTISVLSGIMVLSKNQNFGLLWQGRAHGHEKHFG